MFLKTIAYLALLTSPFLAGCSEEIAPESALPAPVLVQKSNDTTVFERGIRAWPGSSLYPGRGIKLEWIDIKSVPIGGYSLYRTSTIDENNNPTKFLKIATIETGQNPDTTYIDQSVQNGVRYFYKVAAFERGVSKAEGKFSEVEDFTLSSALEGTMPVNGAMLSDSSIIIFRWKIENGTSGYSVIRVFEMNAVNNSLKNPVWIYSGYPSFTDPAFRYNEDGTALLLKSGKTYGWYITQIIPGERNYGSASRMMNFTIK